MKIKNGLNSQLFLLFGICITLVFVWFYKGLIFAGGESGMPFYNLEKSFYLDSYAWRPSQGGYPNVEDLTKIPYEYLLKILSSAGISGLFLQAATFFLILLVGSIAVFHLLGIILQTKNKNLPFLGALFYMLNPYSMMQIWGRGLYSQLFPFALFPLFLLLVILTFQKKDLRYSFVALIASFIFSGAFTNLAFLLSFGFLTGLYGLYYLHRNRSKDEVFFTAKVFLVLAAGFVLTHFWWLNYEFQSLSVLVENRSSSLEHNLGTLRGVSRETPFGSVIRLLHNFLTKDRNYGDIYFNPIFVLLSLLPPVAFLLSLKKLKKSKYFLFSIALFMLSLFVVLGSNLPFGFLFEFLFISFPFLQAFRNPYEKMGIVFILAYTPFFAIGISNLSEFISKRLRSNFWDTKKVSYIIVLFYCGFFVWPMWTGQFAGGFKFNPWVSVPEHYKEANDWLNSQDGDFRIIHMPINPGDGLRYSWPHGYQGTDPSEYLFDKASISKNVVHNKEYYNVLLQRFGVFQEGSYGEDPDIINSEFRSGEFYEELLKLNVRYVILHFDYDHSLGQMQSPQEVENYLSAQSEIAKVKQFNELSIYEVVPYSKTAHIYSPQGSVTYTEIDPSTYSVDVSDLSNSFEIYFLEKHSDNWKAYIDEEAKGEHFKLFSYANAWKFDNVETDKITLIYEPQKIVDKGAGVSFVAVISIIVFLFFSAKNKVYNK